jgi:hypothetical protein
MCQCSGHRDRERELERALLLLIRSMECGQYSREQAVSIALLVIHGKQGSSVSCEESSQTS